MCSLPSLSFSLNQRIEIRWNLENIEVEDKHFELLPSFLLWVRLTNPTSNYQ